MNNRLSFYAWVFCALVLVFASLVYYPRATKPYTEATIGWDVSGYYAWLPAAFVYGDVQKAAFLDEMREKYGFTPDQIQGTQLPNGNFVFKYAMGQAVQYLPWFVVGHVSAKVLGYPADGYSKPYQWSLMLGSLVVALLGLWFARKVLLHYFEDKAVALTLIALVLGTNYLNYGSIDGAMTHNWLFTCLAMLIWFTIRFYERPRWQTAALIGLLCGWAMLTRPTEAIMALIPLAWAVGSLAAVRERLRFVWQHIGLFVLAGGVAFCVAVWQAVYWKYTSGQWLFYSYGTEHFKWREPYIEEVTTSFRCGWLVYSPMMAFGVLGLWWLWRQHRQLFPTVMVFVLLSLYITSAWSTWWYGGTLGMRALVQHYAVWIFPLAAMIQSATRGGWKWLPFWCLFGLFGYLNLWWTREAHSGNAFVSEQMTRQFFWKTIGRNHFETEWLKLLDTRHIFEGTPKQPVQVLSHDFEQDTLQIGTQYPLQGAKEGFVDAEHQFSPEWKAAAVPDKKWYRASCVFAAEPKEWEWWIMTQFTMRFYAQGKLVHETGARMQRYVKGGETKSFHFDVKAPKVPFDTVSVLLWNADGKKKMRFDDVRVVAFDE